MPHAHILIWLQDKIGAEEIDQIISAEIPDQSTDPVLFDIVTKHIIRGPCGAFNMTSPCMEKGKCNKKFPKTHTNYTTTIIQCIGAETLRMVAIHLRCHCRMLQINEFDYRWIVL